MLELVAVAQWLSLRVTDGYLFKSRHHQTTFTTFPQVSFFGSVVSYIEQMQLFLL